MHGVALICGSASVLSFLGSFFSFPFFVSKALSLHFAVVRCLLRLSVNALPTRPLIRERTSPPPPCHPVPTARCSCACGVSCCHTLDLHQLTLSRSLTLAFSLSPSLSPSLTFSSAFLVSVSSPLSLRLFRVSRASLSFTSAQTRVFIIIIIIIVVVASVVAEFSRILCLCLSLYISFQAPPSSLSSRRRRHKSLRLLPLLSSEVRRSSSPSSPPPLPLLEHNQAQRRLVASAPTR